MKKSVFILLTFLCLFGTLLAQSKREQCSYCNMIIRDHLHLAEAVEPDGSVLKFDSVECLVNFVVEHSNKGIKNLRVADYGDDGKFLKAEEAIYLESKNIPSPMGANLSAFSNSKTLSVYSGSSDDKVFTWEELKNKFSSPAMGAVNQHSHHDHFRPDAHAPIGIMGDHLHQKGSLMISFRSMNMQMNGNRQGTEKVNNEEVFSRYMVAPKEMDMEMYMIGLMYAPSNHLTLMLMQNYFRKEMELTAQMTMDGMPMLHDFSTNSNGLGDLSLNVLYGIFNHKTSSLHLNAGISFPLGDIEQHHDTPMADNAKLPYSMQPGSGTFDFSVGGTYKETYSNYSWGSQVIGTFRTAKNSEGYRLGNEYKVNLWGAWRVLPQISFSGRILGSLNEKIQGEDPELNSMMVLTANTSNSGGTKAKTFAGVNFSFSPDSPFRNLRLGAELGTPVYEDYNGIQMDEKYSYNFGLKYTLL